MTSRDKIAHQLGLFFISNVEMEEAIEQLKQQLVKYEQEKELTKKPDDTK